MTLRPRTLRRAALLASLSACAGAGCAGKAPPVPKPLPPPTIAEAPAPLFVSPAHWDFHPPEPFDAIAGIRLPNGDCVFTTEMGQRWLSKAEPAKPAKPKKHGDDEDIDDEPDDEPDPNVTVCSGKAETSVHIAADDLVSVIRRSDSSWLFASEDGKLYEASEPLGPFTRVIEPPQPLLRVAAAGSVVLGTTHGGALLRWDETSGWRPAPNAPPRLFDVALSDDGHALGLSFPETLFLSDDGGKSWTETKAPSVGARKLGLAQDKSILAEGIFASLKWNPAKGPSLTRSTERLPSSSIELSFKQRRGAQPSAVLAGRAVLEGDRYYEVMRPEDNESEAWTLARGSIEGRLETVPIPGADDCGSIRIGARGKYVYTVCVSYDDSNIAARVRRSEDAGSTWSESLKLFSSDTNEIRVAVSPEGDALITGVCKSTQEDGGCRPQAPMLLHFEKNALKAQPTGAPQLSELPMLPAFSLDGRSAYFVGRRGKDNRLTLFVSHDSGKTFSQRSLEDTQKKPERPPSDDEDYDDYEGSEPDDYIEIDESCSLRPGEDGTVGMLVLRSRGYSYITTDEDGRVLHSAAPPGEDFLMAGAGQHVIAITYNDGTDEAPPISLWESGDGGTTWEPQTVSPLFFRELTNGGGSLVCSLAGCLLTDSLSRVGWGGQVDSSSYEAPSAVSPDTTPAVLTPIRCELSPKSPWTRIDNVHSAYGNGSSLPAPDIDEIMRGRSAWSMLTFDPKTGAVGTVNATLPASGEGDARIVKRELVGRRPTKGHSALSISFQMEGYAAVRAAIPSDKDGRIKYGVPLGKIDVAWDNYMEGSSPRATLTDAGTLESSDVAMGNGDMQLQTGLISVSVNGIFVRPHSTRSSSQRQIYFLDGRGKSERLLLPEWPTRGLGGYMDVRTDVAIIDNNPLGVGLVRDSGGHVVSLLLAHRDAQSKNDPAGAGWSTNAISLAPNNEGSLRSRADWTFMGKSSIGMTSLAAETEKQNAFAFFHAFRSDGTFAPPVAVPTLRDLGDRPKPCSAAERASSPRVRALMRLRQNIPMFTGLRHPVLITEPPTKSAVGVSEPLVLLTSSAVVHGTPSSPCVAGWEAEGVRRSPISAVILGDLTHAWAFRVAHGEMNADELRRRGVTAPPQSIELRPMSCHFDPSAPVPDVVWGEQSTAVTVP